MQNFRRRSTVGANHGICGNDHEVPIQSSGEVHIVCIITYRYLRPDPMLQRSSTRFHFQRVPATVLLARQIQTS